jgi:hypothetical protein
MSDEMEYSPSIEETITHTEYSKGKIDETHIPEVTLAFEDDLPVRLDTETRTYEVAATREVQTAERFFTHTVDRNFDGGIKAVRFDNEQAAMFFGLITGSYRSGTAIAYLAKATRDELDLAHMEQVGTSVGGATGVSDRLLTGRLINEAAAGKTHDPRNAALLVPGDIALSIKRKLERAAKTYIPPKKPQVDKKEVKFPNNDWYSNMTEEVLEWVEGLQKTGVDISIQQTRIQTGQKPFVINNVLLGNIKALPEECFYFEKEAAKEVLFAVETLKMRIRPELYIYNTALFEEVTPWGASVSKLRQFINTSACQSRNMIIISDSATQIVDAVEYENEEAIGLSTHRRVSKLGLSRFIRHETGHFIDSNVKVATPPQREAFARSMEYGFSFKNSLQNLRFNSVWEREITPWYLYYLFSTDPKGLVPPEIYDVSSTFYCWLYEKLGPDAFRMFYGRLTGGHYQSWGKGIKRLKYDIEVRNRKEYCRGNVLHCLDSLPKDHRWTWENSEKVVEEYVADINRELRLPRERISTVASLDDTSANEPVNEEDVALKQRPRSE